jgi:hypothetical protein
MQTGGNGNANCFHMREEVAIIFKKTCSVFAGGVQPSLNIDICNTHKFDIFE